MKISYKKAVPLTFNSHGTAFLLRKTVVIHVEHANTSSIGIRDLK